MWGGKVGVGRSRDERERVRLELYYTIANRLA
jgi:hypothetical protein